MSSVYPKRGKLWFRVKIAGKWRSRPTPYGLDERAQAERFAAASQYIIDTDVRSGAHLVVGDLPVAERGAFGWAVHHDAATGRHRLVVHVGDHIDGASCAPFRCSGDQRIIPHRELRRCPPDFEGPAPITDEPSAVYAVAVAPDLRLSRLKIGWTSEIGDRLATYSTIAPTALLLGLWPGNELDEAEAHRIADGRIGTSEVFDCRDVWETISAVGRLMAARSAMYGTLAAEAHP